MLGWCEQILQSRHLSRLACNLYFCLTHWLRLHATLTKSALVRAKSALLFDGTIYCVGKV